MNLNKGFFGILQDFLLKNWHLFCCQKSAWYSRKYILYLNTKLGEQLQLASDVMLGLKERELCFLIMEVYNCEYIVTYYQDLGLASGKAKAIIFRHTSAAL